MKITVNSIGTLIRPRILCYARIYPRPDLQLEPEKWNLSSVTDAPHYGEKDVVLYKKPLEEIFHDLIIGDTTKDLSNCYVGVITSLITSINFRHYVLINSNNSQDIIEKLKKRYQKIESIPIHFVGIKFYKGLKRGEEGKLVPIEPWSLTNETTWFYKPWDLISMETIIRYENLSVGNLVLFKRSKGLIVKTKLINKKKFFKTNSWSCKAVTALLGHGKKMIRFLPNKSFKAIKP